MRARPLRRSGGRTSAAPREVTDSGPGTHSGAYDLMRLLMRPLGANVGSSSARLRSMSNH